ncbi:hypothetical protein AB0H83_34325 [Dactylosporangium sp. NPDC050688]|uniref:hypothetical protein n=1 Tax=Dactylosporangium sp. NPDC050688 TaxID=3157217 RepID=UPI0033F597A9
MPLIAWEPPAGRWPTSPVESELAAADTAADASLPPRTVEDPAGTSPWLEPSAIRPVPSPAMLAAPEDGQVVLPDEAERTYGIPVENQEKFWLIATRHNVVITVRPSNPWVPGHLRGGALPKGEEIKAKTINRVDVQLGADPNYRGLVGFFKPDSPAPESEPAQRRWNQRRREHRALYETITNLVESGRFAIRDGLIFEKGEDGVLRPITGDHDLWNIQDLDGNALPADRYYDIVQEMIDSRMAVKHGAHRYWYPTSEFGATIYRDVVMGHLPGQEPLLRFDPSRPAEPDGWPRMTATYAAEADLRPNSALADHQGAGRQRRTPTRPTRASPSRNCHRRLGRATLRRPKRGSRRVPEPVILSPLPRRAAHERKAVPVHIRGRTRRGVFRGPGAPPARRPRPP